MAGTRKRLLAVVSAGALWACAGAMAQVASAPTLPTRVTPAAIDSGPVQAAGVGGMAPEVVYSTVVTAPGSSWIRLGFGETTLSGFQGTERAAYLRITSLSDGASQILHAEALEQWGDTSAYFNGPAVQVDLIAWPGTGACRVRIDQVMGHDAELLFPQDICGGTDDRVTLTDNRNARVLGFGGVIGSGFMINDTNHFFLTAGHVQPTTGSVVQFNVPLSNPDGTINFPPPEDQYAVEPLSVQRQTSGTGNDWCYFGVFSNSNTALQPPQVNGQQFYTLAAIPPPATGQMVRVSGFGSTTGLQLPFEQSFTLTTATGPLTFNGTTVRYQVDTTGGDSGSAVELVSNGQVIGIHYLAGCDNGGNLDLGNQATPINNANLQFALNSPIGICRTGKGTVLGSIYAIGDQANNFGTASITPNRFAKIAQIGSRWQGLAWDWNHSVFYGCDGVLGLYSVTTTGQLTSLGTITGTGGQVISGLGYDPRARVLWGVAASTGQLYAIDVGTASATPVGSPQGGLVTGLDYDTTRNVLWGIENTTQSKLVSINTTTGVRTVIGNLGSTSIAQCHGLGFNATDGNLYTINASSSILYRVNPATGVATSVGATLGLFGSQFGMAVANARPPCPQDFNGDGDINPDDLGDFITCYFTEPACAGADYNHDGDVNPDDLGDFITAYFGPGC